MSTVLIAKKTEAETSNPVKLGQGETVTLLTDNAGAELIAVEVDMGGTFKALSINGTAQILTSGNNGVQVNGPVTYQVNKPTTASSAGVYVEA